ncbi:dynamin family protein [Clostridium sp. AM58-1XD]|uniref:dynamin family protein n=1 Tax=Clostridium sp. AM58-1XD TaxID=2292307 RepID=UPI000E4C339B|nr:dynamin family protein [Clostridium sp. AM58-1XD]RGY98895.1 hypothetical protein DXA13_09645 [Clostridium sp. AM58-1XD]
MEMQDRIIYDPEEMIRRIESELDKLKMFQFDSKYRALLGDPFISKLSRWEQNIRNRKEDPFTVVVCGEFKRGKSSLINALLGEEVVTTNVTTETVTLNKISYGAHSNEAILSGGRRMRLSDEEMERDRLEELISQAGEPVRQLEIKRPIELLRYVTIIDTPGLGDSMKDFTDMVEQALCQADAVVYLFSVNYPLSQAEQMFLKTVILPQKYTDLFLIGNYADVLSNEKEYERMKQMLEERIHGLLPAQEPWMVSALDERCRQTGEERPNVRMEELLGRNFDGFRSQITRLVQDKKDVILPDRMQRMLRGMLVDLADDLAALENGLIMSSQDVQAAIERVSEQKIQQMKQQSETESRIDGMIQVMQSETYEWIEELLNRMQEDVSTLSDVEAKDLTKYYSFYCIDMMQEAITRCTDYHTVILYDALDEISSELTYSLSKNAQNTAYGFRFALDNKTWTMGDNVSFVVSKIDSLGLFSLVADGIAGAMRQKEMSDKTPDIIKSIQVQYTNLHISVQQAIENTYRTMAENVIKQLAEYYGDKILAAQQQVEQSAMVARQDEAKKEETREAIGKIRSILAQMEM